MKKILSAFLALSLTTNSSVNACMDIHIGSGNWAHVDEESYEKNLYDLTNDGSIDILDMVVAKKEILHTGKISIYDIINLRCYLNGGGFLIPTRNFDWYMSTVSEDMEMVLKEALNSYLTDWTYSNGAVYCRFLRNACVTELIFDRFGKTGEPVAIIDDIGTIRKDKFGYLLDNDFLKNYSFHQGLNVNYNPECFNEEDILYISEDVDNKVTKLYLDRETYLDEISFSWTQNYDAEIITTKKDILFVRDTNDIFKIFHD